MVAWKEPGSDPFADLGEAGDNWVSFWGWRRRWPLEAAILGGSFYSYNIIAGKWHFEILPLPCKCQGPATAPIPHGMQIAEWGLGHAYQQASTTPITPGPHSQPCWDPACQWASTNPGIPGHQPVTLRPGPAHQQAETSPAPHWALQPATPGPSPAH